MPKGREREGENSPPAGRALQWTRLCALVVPVAAVAVVPPPGVAAWVVEEVAQETEVVDVSSVELGWMFPEREARERSVQCQEGRERTRTRTHLGLALGWMFQVRADRSRAPPHADELVTVSGRRRATERHHAFSSAKLNLIVAKLGAHRLHAIQVQRVGVVVLIVVAAGIGVAVVIAVVAHSC